MVTVTAEELVKLQANATDLESQLEAAASEGDVEAIIKLAGQIKDARTIVVKAQREANAEKIGAAESALIAGIRVVVENVDWKTLTGEDITTVVFYRDSSAETEQTGPVFGIHVNPKRGARKKSAGGTSTRKTRSNVKVHRIGEDGEVEELTVKEVVQKYASDEVRASSLFEPKKAWSILFPKVNKTLTPPFEDCDCPEAEETPAEPVEPEETGE